MKRDDSIVLPVDCTQECGMVSAYRFFHDGSYRKIVDACHHLKHLPTRQSIQAQFKAGRFGAPARKGSIVRGKVGAGRPA